MAVALVAIAGCGDDSESSGTQTDGGEQARATVDVGLLPISAVAPVYVGMEQGFFDDEGLDIETRFMAGGAAIVPAIVSGDVDFGYSNPESILLAAGKGLPLRIVAEGNQTLGDESQEPDALVARSADPKDLEGKRVAVNTLGGLTELATRTALSKLGVDDGKVRFIEVGFPDMLTALKSGRVAAAKMNEPFVTAANEAGGLHEIAHPFFATLGPHASVSEYATSAKLVQENPDLVARFQRALNRSLDYSQDHPDLVRRLVPTYTKIELDVANKIRLTYWSSELNTESLDQLVELLVEHDELDEKLDIGELVVQAPSQ